MNAVGTIGEFIIEYQYEIEIGLLVVLGLIILGAVIRAFARAVKRKSVLEEISEKVNDISQALTVLSSEAESAADRSPHPEENAGEKISEGPPVPEETADAGVHGEAAEISEASKVAEAAEDMEPAVSRTDEEEMSCDELIESSEVTPPIAAEKPEGEETGNEDFIPKKYFSRDCGVDKKGNRYTLEELENQIR